MDGSHFDTLVRSLVAARSRRSLTRLLGGLSLSGLLAALSSEEAAATHGCRHTGATCTGPGQCCTGRCAGNGTCQKCTSATQCPAPPLCKRSICTSTGRCVIRNQPHGTDCGINKACCDGQCVNFRFDERYCGFNTCGEACAGSQTCCNGTCCPDFKCCGSGLTSFCCPAGTTCCPHSGGFCVTDPSHCV